jgi:hypothetical protein
MILTHTTAAIMILTSEKILEVHRLIIRNFGGVDGVLCHGNKRSAFQIAELILGWEGRTITASEERIIQMLLRIASYQYKVDEINIWLLENTDKL